MRIVYKRSLTFIGLLIILIACIGVGYLFYDRVISPSTDVAVIDELSVNFLDGASIISNGEYRFSVTNNGSIPAQLMNVPDVTTVNGEEPTQVQFAVSVLGEKMVLQPTETAQIAVVAAWPDDSEDIPEGEVSKTATITLNYQQVTAEDAGD